MLDQLRYVQDHLGNFFKFEYHETLSYKEVHKKSHIL